MRPPRARTIGRRPSAPPSIVAEDCWHGTFRLRCCSKGHKEDHRDERKDYIVSRLRGCCCNASSALTRGRYARKPPTQHKPGKQTPAAWERRREEGPANLGLGRENASPWLIFLLTTGGDAVISNSIDTSCFTSLNTFKDIGSLPREPHLKKTKQARSGWRTPVIPVLRQGEAG